MSGRPIKRPDEDAMLRVLEHEQGTLSEVVLRLAWQAGLSRDEIRQLKWSQVSFAEMQFCLADRSIPMEAVVATCLEHRAVLYQQRSEYVVAGNRGAAQLEPQSISRLARFALDREAVLSGISLKDLRHDFIIRQLAVYPWPFVARISGMASTTMYTMFSRYMREEPAALMQKEAVKQVVQADDAFVQKILQVEGPTPVGIALWMAWRHCMDVTEIITLTWERVDLSGGIMHLSEGDIAMDSLLQEWLQQLYDARDSRDDTHVLLTPKSRRPFEVSRMSKATRTVFIRNGAEHMTFQEFTSAAKRNAVDSRLLQYLAEQGAVTRGDVVALLQTTPAAAYSHLRRLVEQGAIVRIGGKYYLPGTVVPPEQQYEVIQQYLDDIGVAYLQALADLLKIERRACAWILRRFVQEGKLDRKGQLYVLPASKSGDEQV